MMQDNNVEKAKWSIKIQLFLNLNVNEVIVGKRFIFTSTNLGGLIWWENSMIESKKIKTKSN